MFSGDAITADVVALTTLNREIISTRADQHNHPANEVGKMGVGDPFIS